MSKGIKSIWSAKNVPPGLHLFPAFHSAPDGPWILMELCRRRTALQDTVIRHPQRVASISERNSRKPSRWPAFTGTVRSMLSGECTCLKACKHQRHFHFTAFFTYEGQPQKLRMAGRKLEADRDTAGIHWDIYPLIRSQRAQLRTLSGIIWKALPSRRMLTGL